MAVKRKPLVLLILDGWGHRAPSADNAIDNAHTPNLDKLFAQYPSTLLNASGAAVGLPDGQMGNSEVGHLSLGSGRVVYQELTRISSAIANGEFQHNPALVQAIDKAVTANKAVHIMGLLSDGGVHSHSDHIEAMIRMAADRGAKQIYLHAFLDGRDTPPRSAEAPLQRIEALFAELNLGRIATVAGRFYPMDRDQRWSRINMAYHLLTQGQAKHRAQTALAALQAGYQRDESDEFIEPTIIGEPQVMHDDDALIFMNFRADRARQLTRAFIEPEFTSFVRSSHPKLHFVMLTQYAADLQTACAFPPQELHNTLGEQLATHGKTQLRISETEKYAHVTFFFNGGQEQPFAKEERILVDSPKVATYDLRPQMSSEELTNKLISAIKSTQYDIIICNYPNGDMVGHTGDYDAAVEACEAVDRCVGRILDALSQIGGECLITADHGNAEQMRDPLTGQAHTAHTCQPVPFIYCGRNAQVRPTGVLSDVAPTMLYLLGLPIPAEMTGQPLISLTP